MRVAAYCRVSTDKADQANSFEAQQRYFRERIAQNPDWELQAIYADEGLSGTNTKKRRQFNKMIQAAKDGKIDLIITKEVSRFARNTIDTLEHTRALRKLGIGVMFLTDNINTLDADGELRLTIMASLAQEESRRTSHRVKWGQTQSMKKGVVFGGSLLGYHVVNGKISVDPEGAKIVREIFHKYLNERKGVGVIARELREDGISSSRGECKWSSSTVLKLLKNEKYCGDLIQKKTYTPDYLNHEKKYNKGKEEFIVIRDHHEPIIDRAVWDAVQQELQRRRRRDGQFCGHGGNQYFLSGKIRCASCGSSFLLRRRTTKTGEHYPVWRCGKATHEGKLRVDQQGVSVGCDVGRQIREDVAMDILKRTVQAVEIDSEEMVKDLCSIIAAVRLSGRNEVLAEKRLLERELEGERVKKQRALEAFIDQTITKADLQFLNERCNSSIDRITAQIAAMERRQIQDEFSAGEAEDIADAIRGIMTGERAAQAVYARLLHRMTVDRDGRVEIVLEEMTARWAFQLV